MTNYSMKQDLLDKISEYNTIEVIPSSLKAKLIGLREFIEDPLKQRQYDVSLEASVSSGSVLNKSENITYKLDKDSIEYVSEFSKFVNLDQGETCSYLYRGLQSPNRLYTNMYDSIEDNYFREREVNLRLSIKAIKCLENSPDEPLLQELTSTKFFDTIKSCIEGSFANSLKFSDQLELSGKFNTEVNFLCLLYKKAVIATIKNVKNAKAKTTINSTLNNVLLLLTKLSQTQTDHCIKYRLEDDYSNGLITPGHFRLIESLVLLFEYSLQSKIHESEFDSQVLKIGAPLKQFTLLLLSKSIMLWGKNETYSIANTVSKLKESIIDCFRNTTFFSVILTQLANLHYDGTKLVKILPVIGRSLLDLLKIQGVIQHLKNDLVQSQGDLFSVSSGYSTRSEVEYFLKLVEFIEKHNHSGSQGSTPLLLSNEMTLIFAALAKSITISNYNINQFSKTILYLNKKLSKLGKGNKISLLLENSDNINSNNILVTVVEALKLFKNERPNVEEELTLHSVLRLVQCFPDLMVSDADLIQVIIALLSYDGFSSYIRSELLNILHLMTLLSTERATKIWCFIPQFLAMVFVDYKEVQSKDNNYSLSVAFLRLLKSISKGRSMLSFFDTVVEFMCLVLNNQFVGNRSDRKLLIEVCLFVSDNVFLTFLKQQALISENDIYTILNKLFKLYTISSSLMSEVGKKVEKRSPLRMASSSSEYLLKLNTYIPLRLIESSVKSLYIILFNLSNPEEKIHGFVENNKDSIITLLESFPYYAFKLLHLAMLTESFPILNQFVLKSNPGAISSTLYKSLEREEVIKIITLIFEALAQVRNNDRSHTVVEAFVNEFTSTENLSRLFKVINNENTSNENINLALVCLRSILCLGLKKDIRSFELCIRELHLFLIIDEGGENELRISKSVNEPIITNKQRLSTESKKLAIQCLTLVFDTANNWATIHEKDLGFMKRISIREVINSYFVSFLDKEKDTPSFELLNDLMEVFLNFQKYANARTSLDSEITSRILEALTVYRNNLTEFEQLIHFIELTKNLVVDRVSLIKQIINISKKSESSHLRKVVYEKISLMLEVEQLTTEAGMSKWAFMGNMELIKQVIKEVSLILNTIKVTRAISGRKSTLFLSKQNEITEKKHIQEIINGMKMLNFAVYLVDTDSPSVTTELKGLVSKLQVDVLVKLLFVKNNEFNLNTKLLMEIETLLANIFIKVYDDVNEFIECIMERFSVYDTVEKIIKQYEENEDKLLLNSEESFEVLIHLLMLFINLPISLTYPYNLFKRVVVVFENKYFESLNYLYLYSKGRIVKNDRKLNLSLICVEMCIIINVYEGKQIMKLGNIFANNKEFIERRNIETELNDMSHFIDTLKIRNREGNYSKRISIFVDFVECLNKD